MGATESVPDNEEEDNVAAAATAHSIDDAYDPFDGIETLGYRVLGVQPNSPASQAGLVSFLDFLVGVNQQMLLGSGEHLLDGEEYDDVDLPAFLEAHKHQPVEFLVFNIKSQASRLVELTPSDTWGGAGLMGVTIRLDNYAGAEERLLRVLDVVNDYDDNSNNKFPDPPPPRRSPAAVAGLIPYSDYLLGTTTTTLDSVHTLAQLLQQYQDQVLELYVYNCDTDMVRVVALWPTYQWDSPRILSTYTPGSDKVVDIRGNSSDQRPLQQQQRRKATGLLGAAVGTGYLHRLPSRVCDTEGSSVERKVRYVNTNSTSNIHHAHPTAIPNWSSGRNTVAGGLAMLEVEPQLEMEMESETETETDTKIGKHDRVVAGSPDRSVSTDASPIPTRAASTINMNTVSTQNNDNHRSERSINVETVVSDDDPDMSHSNPDALDPMRSQQPISHPMMEMTVENSLMEPVSRNPSADQLKVDLAYGIDQPPGMGVVTASLSTIANQPISPQDKITSPSNQPRTHLHAPSLTNVMPPPPKMHY